MSGQDEVVTFEQRLLDLLGAADNQDPVRAKAARSGAYSTTKHLDWLNATEPLLKELVASGACQVVDGPRPIGFDADGQFSDWWSG